MRAAVRSPATVASPVYRSVQAAEGALVSTGLRLRWRPGRGCPVSVIARRVAISRASSERFARPPGSTLYRPAAAVCPRVLTPRLSALGSGHPPLAPWR